MLCTSPLSVSHYVLLISYLLVHVHVYGYPIGSMHQPSVLYPGGQSVSSGPSPPSQMDTGGYLPPFLLGSPAAKSVSYQ